MRSQQLVKSDYPPANILLENMAGAFDALDRGYLQELQVVISVEDKEAEPAGGGREKVLETYKFSFGASSDQEFIKTMMKKGGDGDDQQQENINVMTPGSKSAFFKDRGFPRLRQMTCRQVLTKFV